MIKCIHIYLIILVTVSIYSQPVPPVKVEVCPGITEIPVMDGLADEGFWSEDQTLSIFSLSNEADWTGETDYHITFKMAWGWSYFYTLVTITDDIEHTWNGTDGNPWEFDNVEWFFQLDTQTVPTTYTDNTIQIRFNRGETGFQASSFRSGITTDDFQWFSENNADGWVLECAIPWSNIMPDGSLPEDIDDWIEDGGIIGFDLSGADSDGTEPLVGDRGNGTQMAWDEDGESGDIHDGTEDNAWNNTSVFGYLYLSYITDIIETAYRKTHILLYPNPANDYLHLTTYQNHRKISIYSLVGQLIIESKIRNSSIDVSSIKPGIYVAVIDETDVVKFIKE